MTMYY
ncbi:hypothetical protein N7458_012481 [Penicillium daleae]